MSDFATLGFKIDSGPLKEGTLNLEKMAGAAGKVDTAATKMATDATRAFRTVATSTQSMDALNRSLDRTEMEIRSVTAATTAMQAGISNVAGGVRATATAFDIEAAAAKRAADAIRQHNIAAAATRGGNLNTANVAAQFQDIGVTAAMGMSPTMIALQQGTQLSAALGSQGLKGTVTALGAAFASVLSPVSLLTIAAVGLGAAGVQALMGIMNSTDDATSSLERHSSWLDKILLGYDSARDAAEAALQAALKLPQASADSNLVAEQAEAAERALAAMQKAIELRDKFGAMAGYASSGALGISPEVTAELVKVSDVMTKITADSRLTGQELDQLHISLTQLANTTTDQNIREIANEALGLVDAAREAEGQVKSTTAALAELRMQSPISIAINVATEQVTAAIEQLRELRPELRTPGQVTRDNASSALQTGLGSSEPILRMAAQAEYDKTIAALDEMDRRAAAMKASRASGSGSSPGNQWGSATGQMEQRIAQMQLEMQLMGQSTFEVDRQTMAFELLNQAKASGIPITDSVTAQIASLSSEYATATSQMEMAMEAQRNWQQNVDFARGTFQGFFSDLRSGMSDGVLGWDDLANAGVNALNKIADRALSMAADGIFDMIFGSIFGGGAGALVGGFQQFKIRKDAA